MKHVKLFEQFINEEVPFNMEEGSKLTFFTKKEIEQLEKFGVDNIINSEFYSCAVFIEKHNIFNLKKCLTYSGNFLFYIEKDSKPLCKSNIFETSLILLKNAISNKYTPPLDEDEEDEEDNE